MLLGQCGGLRQRVQGLRCQEIWLWLGFRRLYRSGEEDVLMLRIAI